MPGFKIPNYTEAVSTGVGDQAEPDSLDFSILGNPANGVLLDLINYPSNGIVTQTSSPSNTVNIAAYKVVIDGNRYHNDGTTITVSLDAGEANPRFDLVVIPKATPTVPTFRKGAASSTNPQFPVIVDGDIVLAAIYRAGTGITGYATTGYIIDKRLVIPSNGTWISTNEPTLVPNSDGAKAANGDIWVTTASAATGKSNVWVKSDGAWENLAEYIAVSTTNVASTLVQRDASGNFAANVVTAVTFAGKANTAGVADSANAVSWANVGGKPAIVYNDNGTYTINISGNAATATSAVNSGKVADLNVHSARNNEANKIVRTDGTGYLQTGYINSGGAPYNEYNNSSPDRIWGSNSGGDSYLRTFRTSALNVNSADKAINLGYYDAYSNWRNTLSGGILGTLASDDISPVYDNSYSLGRDFFGRNYWSTVYSYGYVNASDERIKTDISNSLLGLDFIKTLRPVSYRMKVGKNIVNEDKTITEKPGVRTHYGFLAQEVKKTIDDSNIGDFAGWVISDLENPDSEQALNYIEFISPMVKAMQEMAEKIESLEARLQSLEAK